LVFPPSPEALGFNRATLGEASGHTSRTGRPVNLSPQCHHVGYNALEKFDASSEPVLGDLTIDELQAEVIRRIFRDSAAGKSAKRIAFDAEPGRHGRARRCRAASAYHATYSERPGGGPMPRKEIVDALRKYTDPFRVAKGKDFRLKDFDPGDTLGLKMDKEEAAQLLQRGSEWLAMEQDMLYAQDSWSLLLVLQAMDAAGKDGTIKHVMSRVNPQGCEVVSFKQPSDEELSHDFLWRYSTKVPQRGRIGIFNRSYYEEVLVVRVHQQLLEAQKIPLDLVGKTVWDERLADIARFEDYLTRQGVVILKFYLNLSYKEQKKRFLDRLDKPDKHWKFSVSDVRERRYWNDYMQAYDEAIRATASKAAPWFVVPADNKWFTRLVVAAAIVEAVEELDLEYPKVTSKQMKDLAAAREELKAEG
jgi:PPK2 family polyphosphate:nucleotide phosphotransferase